MTIAVADVRTATEETLKALLGLPETQTLDFKRDVYGRADSARREFCKDVCGLANTRGGDLVLGIEEKEHVAALLIGLPRGGLKDELQRLQQLVLTAIEPRILGVTFHEVPLSNGNSALVIRVPQSMDLPHRISQNNSNQFFVRHTTDTVEASLLELRRMFELAGSELKQAESFHMNRVSRLMGNREPCSLSGKDEGYSALHIIPFGYGRQSGSLDLSGLYDGPWLTFMPIGAASARRYYCADGFAAARADGEGKSFAYTLVMRSGAVEAPDANLFMSAARVQDARVINAIRVRDDVEQAVASYLKGLIALGAHGPWFVCLTLCNCQNARVAVPNHSGWEHERLPTGPVLKDACLSLPSVMVEEKHADRNAAREALRPMPDALWQAAGKGKM